MFELAKYSWSAMCSAWFGLWDYRNFYWLVFVQQKQLQGTKFSLHVFVAHICREPNEWVLSGEQKALNLFSKQKLMLATWPYSFNIFLHLRHAWDDASAQRGLRAATNCRVCLLSLFQCLCPQQSIEADLRDELSSFLAQMT